MIYFIQHGKDGPIKIGYTKSENALPRRLSFLQIGSPIELHPVGIMDGTLKDEKALHDRFKDDLIRSEWFALTEQITAFIKAHSRPIKKKDRPQQEYIIPNNLPELLTVKDMCEIFNCTKVTVYTWINKEYLNAFKIKGGELRIPSGQLQEFIPPGRTRWDLPPIVRMATDVIDAGFEPPAMGRPRKGVEQE